MLKKKMLVLEQSCYSSAGSGKTLFVYKTSRESYIVSKASNLAGRCILSDKVVEIFDYGFAIAEATTGLTWKERDMLYR